jgi:hypothetical protein
MDPAVLDVRHADSALIDRMGGTVEVARLCEVTPQAVTQWRRAGIPHPRRMYLAVVRPDVVPKHEAQAGAD